ncbi:hypothetical protein PV332_10605 [Streptomyces scabiei]|uniref:hypothetical protein n=1 Tax=Streptomyces scabiei TaxID=1930 RepID=UPI0029B86EDD|nr:hypothetical protein [Streptomyces scabiei]MDX2575931.1 hypothetical protein [Streptomyces scabiei]MDX2794038.1 hypothetical protein [Streptomyces scabiei]MDX2885596.1 hypothetical protein [Streptomyces scabiei]MDX2993451.1 hypothetical protein [Streptomyces scabiei]MDX3028435.1 hypothetical protein [Streptomyces scabiei]
MSGSLHVIDAANAPALGDVRAAGEGDLIYVRPDATSRKDFPKYWEAVGTAFVRGALVHVMNREEN